MPADELATVLDSPVVREAATVVLETTDGIEAEFTWSDVSDGLSREQWGRLVASGAVVGGTDGFRFENPEQVRQRLLDDGSDTDFEFASWTRSDKLAGVVALALVTGYWNTGIRDTIASVDNLVLGPVTSVVPFYLIILALAAATGLYSTVLQSRLRDTETVERYQNRLQRLKDRKAAAEERGDDEALERLEAKQRDAATDQLSVLKSQFRPMVWIMLLTVPVFLWLRWKVRGGHLGAGQGGLVVPLAGPVTWQAPLFGPMPTWIVWYFLCSVVSRQVVQKSLDGLDGGS